MVLSEAILITAYFLGLRRTYRLALKTERRVFKRFPRIQQFAERNIKHVFRLAKRGIQEVEQRDLAFGKYLGSLVDKTPSWAFFRDPTVTRTEKISAMRESLRAAVASRKARRKAEAAGASRADAAKMVKDHEEERFEGQAPRVVIEERVKERVKEWVKEREGEDRQGVRERIKDGVGVAGEWVDEVFAKRSSAEGQEAGTAEPGLERVSSSGSGSDPKRGDKLARGQEAERGPGSSTASEGGQRRKPAGSMTRSDVRETDRRKGSVSARGYHSRPGLAQMGPEHVVGLTRFCSPGACVLTGGRGATARFVQDCLVQQEDTSASVGLLR